MNKLNKIQQFQLFCLESYRTQIGISGIKALDDFKKFKVFDYLAAGYDVLHTQGKIFLLADINDFLNRRK
jgi:hypothetical protein